MNDDHEITLVCSACGGDGVQNIVWGNGASEPYYWQPIPCPQCQGTGTTPGGTLDFALPLSNPPQGAFRITNIYVNAAGKVVIVYDDIPA